MKRLFILAAAGLLAFGACANKEKQALDFLYRYMPLADSTDYSREFFENQVHASFVAREEMPWGKDVPELLFKHFVLPLRVNNENLDTSRVAFYRELKPRVEGLGMKEAILEVNHWCHEKVTYQPSDARTFSPLASVRTSLGRCGEESTFCVAALRSVGIPARQVYTPRWAHTDDNHAWVEAWADGQWWFLGACEPEPVLNLGWFNAPASRAMLMHTKVFGHYEGPEEVVLEGPNYTEVNLIDNYAPTAKVKIQVLDAQRNPLEGARVYFMIYNYAEFYPALSKYTDGKGETSLSAGLGDMLAWAVKDGAFGFKKISFGKDSEVQIIVGEDINLDLPLNIDIVPPGETANIPEVTAAQRAENDRRFAYEDSLRHAYMATFVQEGDELLVKSMGNHKVIEDFLAAHPDSRARELLQSLSTKDLRDVTPDILEDSYNAQESILCPRVENEFLTPYKGFFLSELSGDERAELSNPEALIKWVKENITVLDEPKAWKIPQSPISVFKYRRCYANSRDVFFVALARTLGIDARKDPVTGKIQYRKDQTWVDVNFDGAQTKTAPQGTLKLIYANDDGVDNPKYYSHFSISKIVDGKPQLLSFDEEEVDMGGGMDYQHAFKNGISLDEGLYILTSGNRLSNGSVPVTLQYFTIEDGKTTERPLIIRKSAFGVGVIGDFDSEAKFTSPEGESVSILSQTGRGFYAIGLLDIGKEPSNHALNDLSRARENLQKWGRPIILLCTSEAQYKKLLDEIKAGRYGTLPSNVIFGIDKDGSVRAQFERNYRSGSTRLPLFAVADTFNKVYFLSNGYTIGLGEQLVDVSRNL